MTRLENNTHTDIVTLGDNQKQLEQAHNTIQTGNLVPKEEAPDSGTPNSSVTGETAFSPKPVQLMLNSRGSRKEHLSRQHQATLKAPTSRGNAATPTAQGRSWSFWCHIPMEQT